MKVVFYARKLYAKRPINGHFSTAGVQGPICADKAITTIKRGLQWISQSDKFFRNFSVTNPQIAHASERWYGKDIAQRALLGNASDRHRCIVDMVRNNNGGLFRAIFSKGGQLKKTLSISKDKTSLTTIYQMGHIDGIGLTNFTKKVVRATDGKKVREIYTASSHNNPKKFLSFIVDAEKGLKEVVSSDNGILITQEGNIYKHLKPKANGHSAGINSSLQSSLNAIKTQGWVKFLQNKFKA